ERARKPTLMPRDDRIDPYRVVSGPIERDRDEQFPGAGERRRQRRIEGLRPVFGLTGSPAVAAGLDLGDRSLPGEEGKNRFRAVGGGPVGVAVDSFCGVFAVSRTS